MFERIIVTTIICVTLFGVSTQMKACAKEESKKVIVHYNYNCEDAPPEHK